MKIQDFALSDVGRVRSENQDSSLALASAGLWVVADGMGGHAGGKQASETAVDTLRERLGGAGSGASSDRLRAAIEEAHRRIRRGASENPALRGMGTTVVALLLTGERSGIVAHVGDSRAYRLRDGQVERLTDDHSLVAEMIRRQDLTESDAEHHPYRHMLTRALGVEETVDVELADVDVSPGDVFVLCSDGVSGMLDRGELERIVRDHADDGERLCRALVDAANGRGGRDNATVVAVRCLTEP